MEAAQVEARIVAAVDPAVAVDHTAGVGLAAAVEAGTTVVDTAIGN
jgi:hypothetical protein